LLINKIYFIYEITNEYHSFLLSNLAKSFSKLNYECKIVSSITLEDLDENNIIFFSINLLRPNIISKNLLWICWIQDKYKFKQELEKHKIDQNTKLTLLAHIKILSIDKIENLFYTYLGIGVEESTIKVDQRKIDIIIDGYIHPGFSSFYKRIRIPRIKFIEPLIKINRRLRLYYINIVTNYYYMPYIGMVANNQYRNKIEFLLNDGDFPEKNSTNFVDELELKYPRFIERYNWAKKLIGKDINFRIYGLGWGEYRDFANNYYGEINEHKLNEIYANTKIVIHTNSNGYGMHNRVLNAMSNGCCIITHKSSIYNEKLFGHINNEFIENEHYLIANNKNIFEIVQTALDTNKLFNWKIIGSNAKNYIIKYHTSMKRSIQIINEIINKEL
jgi:hypothetical protein